MKTLNFHCSKSLALAASLLLAGSSASVFGQYQSDDFNDGNDAGWTRYDPIGSHPSFPDQGTWTYPDGGYRLQAAPSPLPDPLGPARVGSLRSEVYSDFYISVDVVKWDDTLDQSFGPFARLTNVGLGSTRGYVMTYQARGHDIDITRIKNEAAEHSVRQNGNGDVELVPGKSYRFVFIGKGALLTARVYELPDTATPIVEISGTDPEPYTSGVNGLLVYDNSNDSNAPADATFDNYFATDVEPPRIKMTDLNFGAWELSWPPEASQFVLQSSTVLPGTAADWTDVSDGVIPPTEGFPAYRYNIDAPAGLPKQFFRLVRHPVGAN